MSPQRVFLLEELILEPKGMNDFLRSFLASRLPSVVQALVRMRGRIQEKTTRPLNYNIVIIVI